MKYACTAFSCSVLKNACSIAVNDLSSRQDPNIAAGSLASVTEIQLFKGHPYPYTSQTLRWGFYKSILNENLHQEK